jgi:hypothetical protein
MHSVQEPAGDFFMGDGMVTDLSLTGLRIRGNVSVIPEKELTIFLYLPDGQDPLFVMEARVGLGLRTSVRSRDSQDESAGMEPAPLLLAFESRLGQIGCQPACGKGNSMTE